MNIVQGWRNMTFCLKPNNKSSQVYKSLSVWKTNKRYWEHTKSEDTEKKQKRDAFDSIKIVLNAFRKIIVPLQPTKDTGCPGISALHPLDLPTRLKRLIPK